MSAIIDLRDSNVPQRLRELRRDRSVTQAVLAMRAGISSRTVSDIESGQRARVQEGTLMLLCEALDVSLQTVLMHPHELLGRRRRTAPRRRRYRAARLRAYSGRRCGRKAVCNA